MQKPFHVYTTSFTSYAITLIFLDAKPVVLSGTGIVRTDAASILPSKINFFPFVRVHYNTQVLHTHVYNRFDSAVADTLTAINISISHLSFDLRAFRINANTLK